MLLMGQLLIQLVEHAEEDYGDGQPLKVVDVVSEVEDAGDYGDYLSCG